jgi:ankyrin repeat protein
MPEPIPAHAAFIDAIKAGEFDRVKVMVSADPTLLDARARTGESAILTAVYRGQKAIVNLLVSRGAPMTLCEASAAGEVERVERLLDDGAAVDVYSDDGWTPLHLAAFFGHVKIAEQLLSRGADVLARSLNSNANTPLHAALAGSPPGDQGPGSSQMLLVGLLIGHGADVNSGDRAGWRPLHLAAASDNLDAMKALVAQGGDVHVQNGDGRTPLSLAQEKNHREAAAFLRRHGA